MKDQKEQYMEEAVSEAYTGIQKRHGGPFGAVIVKEGRIVGRGHNQVLAQKDPTCHGEIMAIHDACKNLDTHDLTGCELYTTAAPCPMCKGAILWANIDKVYYGCTIGDTDKIGFRDEVFYKNWEKTGDDFGEECNREKCQVLFQDYLKERHKRY